MDGLGEDDVVSDATEDVPELAGGGLIKVFEGALVVVAVAGVSVAVVMAEVILGPVESAEFALGVQCNPIPTEVVPYSVLN